jgi:hypothetical protein
VECENCDVAFATGKDGLDGVEREQEAKGRTASVTSTPRDSVDNSTMQNGTYGTWSRKREENGFTQGAEIEQGQT